MVENVAKLSQPTLQLTIPGMVGVSGGEVEKMFDIVQRHLYDDGFVLHDRGTKGLFINQRGQGDIALVTAEDEVSLLECELHGDGLSSRDLLPVP